MLYKENQNIEWKESWRDEYLKWICGFANSQGGVLYIGVNDEGRVVGIPNAERLFEEIPNKVRDLLETEQYVKRKGVVGEGTEYGFYL